MPISSEDFDKSLPNSQAIQFLKEHPNEAYSDTELCGKFGSQTYSELQYFLSKGTIENKVIPNPSNGKFESYYRIKKSFRVKRPPE